jgi:crossover junction endodeoxyribonuclease RuvC
MQISCRAHSRKPGLHATVPVLNALERLDYHSALARESLAPIAFLNGNHAYFVCSPSLQLTQPPHSLHKHRITKDRANIPVNSAGMRVLGIDCGTECTGYGLVELNPGDELHCINFGAIQLSRQIPLPARLSTIFDKLCALILECRPDRVAIEDVFYAVNVKSALKLGQVRGVAMLAASSHKIEVAEYAPLTIKAAVVGYGKAEKSQVQLMVARLLRLEQIPHPADAADALAIAICDLHTCATHDRQRAVGL